METTNKPTYHEDLSQADVRVTVPFCRKEVILDQVTKYAQENMIDGALILNTHCCLIFVSEFLMKDGSRQTRVAYHIIPVWNDKETVMTMFSHYQELNRAKVHRYFNPEQVQAINSYPLFVGFNNSTVGYPAHQKYLEAFNQMMNHYCDFVIRGTNGAFTIR